MTFQGEVKGKLKGAGESHRTIPQTLTEFSRLLNSGAAVDVLNPLIAQLEGMYDSVHSTMGIAPQHEADAANTMNGIRRVLSDPRLEGLGIHSRLALPPEPHRVSPQGHHK